MPQPHYSLHHANVILKPNKKFRHMLRYLSSKWLIAWHFLYSSVLPHEEAAQNQKIENQKKKTPHLFPLFNMETQISICSRSQISPQNQLLADNPLLRCKMFLHLYPQVSTILDSITTYFPLFFSLTNSEPLETQENTPKQNCTKGQANMDNQRVEFWRDFFV